MRAMARPRTATQTEMRSQAHRIIFTYSLDTIGWCALDPNGDASHLNENEMPVSVPVVGEAGRSVLLCSLFGPLYA